jgi:hypothetical protein
LGYIHLTGSLPGVPSIGPTETNLAKAKECFKKAKALDVDNVWSGPPREYLEALEEEKRQNQPIDIPRQVDDVNSAIKEEKTVGGLLWDYSLYLSCAAVGAAFAFDYYRQFRK